MRLSMQLDYAGDRAASIERILEYEKRGLDVVWVSEAYSFDAVSAMGFLAAKTTSLQIGSGILPIYSRTPSLIAMTAASIDALTGGRAILGLGSSGPQVIEGWHGVPFDRPIERTREIVQICRKIWRRELATSSGVYEIPLSSGSGTGLGKALRLVNRPFREEIPIYLAAIGPRNVEMAAEIAQGWLPIFFVPEYLERVWGESLKRGSLRRESELGPLEIVAGGLLFIGENSDKVLDLARPLTALYIGGMGAKGRNFYNDLAVRYGFSKEAKEIQDLYLAGEKERAAGLVPLELLRLSNFVGTKEFVRDRVEAFRSAGVTILSVNPVGENGFRDFEILKGFVG